MADKSRKELKGEQHEETRKQLLADASYIYQAESAAGARERLCAFAQKWAEQAPKAVETLQRDFEQTLTFYALEGIHREIIRSTSLLERTNRRLRRVPASMQFRQSARSRSDPLLTDPVAQCSLVQN